MKKIKDRTAGIVMTVLSLLLTVGVKTFFGACGPKEDGSWMTCHWAEQAVFMAGIALAVISVITLAAGRSKTAAGASLGGAALAAVTAFVPGIAINLCMMTNMHCHTVMRPAVIVLCVLIAVTGCVNSFLLIRNDRKNGAHA